MECDMNRLGHRLLFHPRTMIACFLLVGLSHPHDQVQAKEGGKHSESSQQKPWWFGSVAGINDQVPAPWTPLQVHQNSNSINVQPWGRQYRFGSFVFPDQVEAEGSSLLAGPMRIVARVDGNLQSWTAPSLSIDEKNSARVIFSQKTTSDDLIVSARTTVEYDGLVRVDWKLEPRRNSTLDQLTFEIPLKKKHARYYYSFPGSWGVPKAGNLPANRFVITDPLTGQDRKPHGNIVGFRPYVWLGDDDRGLAWFSESDKNWYAKSGTDVTEIITEGDTVVLRLQLVSMPLALSPDGKTSEQDMMTPTTDHPGYSAKKDLAYTFGLQATPVKPVTKDVWDYRITHIDRDTNGRWETPPAGVGSGPDRMAALGVTETFLDGLASSGVKTICLHDSVWTDTQGYFETDQPDSLKRVVRGCHERGIEVLVYLGFHFSDRAPEWPQFGSRCITWPMYGGYRPFAFAPTPMQSAYTVCFNSVWQDATVAGIARLMDKYQIDGVYLDGTQSPWACMNREHGCGYFRPNGDPALTYPIFAVRNLMQRIYKVVRQRNPEGQVNVHNSTCLTTPTIAFATSIWDGEQFGKNFKPGTFPLDALPLDKFRTLYGPQWGVPTELLWRQGAPCARPDAYAFALLHDVLIREGYENTPTGMDPIDALKLQSQLWALSDEFGRKEATWRPYWNNQQFVTTGPEGAYTSLYQHTTNGVLAVISNLSRSEATVEVRFQLDQLGLGQISAVDALTKEPVTITDGTARILLKSLGWRLVWLKGKG